MKSAKRLKLGDISPSDEENERLFGRERIWANLMGNREGVRSVDKEVLKSCCPLNDLFGCTNLIWLQKLSTTTLNCMVRIIGSTDWHHVKNQRSDRLLGVDELMKTTIKDKSRTSIIAALSTFIERNRPSSVDSMDTYSKTTLNNGGVDERFELAQSICALETTLTILDVSVLTFTSFHAIEKRLDDDEMRFVVFLSMFQSLIDSLKPKNFALCFDSKTGLVKCDKHDSYKASRVFQVGATNHFERVDEFAQFCKLPCFRQNGFEADDVINSLTQRWLTLHPSNKVIVVTSDKDFFQICSPRVWIYKYIKSAARSNKNHYHLYFPSDVLNEFGVRPDQFVDFQCLAGDASDGVVGLPGVGLKGARELLMRHQTLERVFQHAAAVGDLALLNERKRILEQNKEQLTFYCPEIEFESKDKVRFDVFRYLEILEVFLAKTSNRISQEFRKRFGARMASYASSKTQLESH